ncbi:MULTISPECIES: nitroreductase family protein [unclassified Solwaraspora]|uniref:nitroreductase family protein n=1 Tax=unclassified Solwaraspora TaxID=2627926 RepID=UPI00259B3F71|nr:nitroreductase family protein [Solwaraspora sp. WMMA2056]WJK39610.1 nitroreductase family protein [Solwaraspora sp. WMMA2056]
MSDLRKTATTAEPLHPLLAQRWSPRAFDPDHQLTDQQVTALLEAARWAPSAGNSQPWRFAVARRGSAAHTRVLDTLDPGNQLWAPAAAALIVVAAQTVTADGTSRPWAAYDTGQAVAHLSVQAQHEGLAVHQMGGFDRDRLAALLDHDPTVTPLAVVAVGRRAPADGLDALDATLGERERAPRQRLSVTELTLTVGPALVADRG